MSGGALKGKRGAPLGNKNAVGNRGGGAPLKNKNALKHGVFSHIYYDVLDDEERELIATMKMDEVFLFQEQIRLYTVRELRIMRCIQEKQRQGTPSTSSVTRSEEKRSFKSDKERKRYEAIQAEKVERKEKLPGESYHVTTVTENTGSVISRLEQELTSVQRAKTKCIESLARLNLEREKLALILEKESSEIEDLEAVDNIIYMAVDDKPIK